MHILSYYFKTTLKKSENSYKLCLLYEGLLGGLKWREFN